MIVLLVCERDDVDYYAESLLKVTVSGISKGERRGFSATLLQNYSFSF